MALHIDLENKLRCVAPGVGGLPPEVDAKFLQDLGAQYTSARAPKTLNNIESAPMLQAHGRVVRVDQNVGVYEVLIAHEVHPVSGEASNRG